MRKFLSRRGVPPAAAGLAILVQALVARMVLQADEVRVYFLGQPLNWACSFHERFGLPCPTCGLTRSVVLTLHGQVERAWRIAPGGPAFALGVLFTAAGLLLLAAAQSQPLERKIKLGLQNGALAWAGVSLVIWLAGWAGQFSSALRAVH
jgi:hypothetical protein